MGKSIPQPSGDIRLEVIVIDNGSRDGSLAMVRSEFPWVKTIQSEIDLGFGGATNRAYQEATGRFIVLLNSDALPLRPISLLLSFQKMEADPAGGNCGWAADWTRWHSPTLCPNVSNSPSGVP